MPHVIREFNEGQLWLRLDNPSQLNALTTEMQLELIDALERDARRDDVRVVILRGAGDRAFSAGGSMDGLGVGEGREMYERGLRMRRAIVGLDKPVLAAISGWCVGGGFELCLYCDLLYADEGARFKLPEVSIGLTPGWGGAIRLRRKVASNKARELVYFGEAVSAREAEALGLVNRVFPAGTVFDEVSRLAQKLCAQPPQALAGAKALMRDELAEGSIDDALALERHYAATLSDTEAHRQAVAAFRLR